MLILNNETLVIKFYFICIDSLCCAVSYVHYISSLCSSLTFSWLTLTVLTVFFIFLYCYCVCLFIYAFIYLCIVFVIVYQRCLSSSTQVSLSIIYASIIGSASSRWFLIYHIYNIKQVHSYIECTLAIYKHILLLFHLL